MKTPYETKKTLSYRCQRCGAWFTPRKRPRPGKQGCCGKCKSPYWWYPRATKQETPPC